MPGYSGTPLSKKLGIKPQMTWVTLGAPREYGSWLGDLPAGARVVRTLSQPLHSPLNPPLHAVHLFITARTDLEEQLLQLREQIEPNGFVWVSWPKKSSKVVTDVTEDVIREVALPMGWVDIKVCAVSEVWSGLKLVIRRSERSST